MKKVLISLIIFVFLVIVVVTGLFFWSNSGPQKKDFIALENPRLLEKKDVKAIIVDFNGNPNTVIKEAYGKLFKVYFRLPGVPKGKGMRAPVARYEGFEELLGNATEEKLKDVTWKGFVAIPVPDLITSLPEDAGKPPYPARLEKLSYGLVAEIAHFGPYETEKPAIERLQQYISDQGYQISGLHEEEYFKGPGNLLIKPADYITVIRYQVRKIRQGLKRKAKWPGYGWS